MVFNVFFIFTINYSMFVEIKVFFKLLRFKLCVK